MRTLDTGYTVHIFILWDLSGDRSHSIGGLLICQLCCKVNPKRDVNERTSNHRRAFNEMLAFLSIVLLFATYQETVRDGTTNPAPV